MQAMLSLKYFLKTEKGYECETGTVWGEGPAGGGMIGEYDGGGSKYDQSILYAHMKIE
jgi:hypothetical protein